MRTDIVREIESSIETKKDLLSSSPCITVIQKIAEACIRSLGKKGKVIFAGNGGSFADAQHLSAEFTSRFMFDRAPLASIALATNSSSITAIGNDFGFENVFSREIEAIGSPDDVFLAISTSGNSENILRAVTSARKMEIPTFGFSGLSGGELANLCECLLIPSSVTARIQESHILAGHIICMLAERELFGNVQ